MPTTTGYSFGDIVLVPFPFTDQSATKKRPAVVVSSDAYHRRRIDSVVLAVTSQISGPRQAVGEALIMKWQEAGLPKPSLIKPVFATIERGLVLRKLGALQGQEQVTGWLLRVARNRLADLFRKRRPESFSDAAPTGEDDEPARPEDPGPVRPAPAERVARRWIPALRIVGLAFSLRSRANSPVQPHSC